MKNFIKKEIEIEIEKKRRDADVSRVDMEKRLFIN
jgi:hypothetical protein